MSRRQKPSRRPPEVPEAAARARQDTLQKALANYIVLPLVLLGMLALGWSWAGQVITVFQVNTWPETDSGRVLASGVDSVVMHGDRRVGATFYRPAIRYRYAVDGQSYEGTTYQISPGFFDTRDQAAAIADSYGPGERVAVYYRPDDPGQAYLARSEVTWLEWVGLAIYLFLTLSLFGGLAAVLVLSRRAGAE